MLFLRVIKKIQRQIAQNHLLSDGDTILVGVSGGPDSVCLLDVLVWLAKSWPTRRRPQLHVCHLNHQLRGAASNADERFVRTLAEKYRLPCTVGRCDVCTLAKTNKLSLEQAARQARLEFFARTVRQLQARHRGRKTKVALAHSADDQVETFLMRLFRGAGMRGLAAMRPIISLREWGGLKIIRPMLEVTREEILRYLHSRKLKFRTDTTNRDFSFLRNRIRHQLLPLLERHYRMGIRAVLRRTADILAEEDKLLDKQAAQALKKCLARDGSLKFGTLNHFPLALRRRVLRRWLAQVSPHPFASFARISRTMEQAIPSPTSKSSENRAYSYKLTTKLLPKPKNFSPKHATRDRGSRVEYFDADKIGRWSVRFWQPGDRMRPLGMQTHKKLQDIFVDAKVPAAARPDVQLVVAENGQIAWAAGVRMSEDFKVTPDTRRLLRVQVSRSKQPSIELDH